MLSAAENTIRRRLLLAATTVLVIGAASAAPAAQADQKSFRPVKTTERALIFDVRSLNPGEVRRASVELRSKARHRVRPPRDKKITRKVRRAARRDNALRLRSSGARRGTLTVSIARSAPGSNPPGAGSGNPGPAPSGSGSGPTPGTGYTPVSTLGPVPADARYVSPTGSDQGAGTAEQPWQTLDKAADAARPGDTVVVEAGTYGALGETLELRTSGSEGAPITFRGDPGGPMPRILGHVKISGSYQVLNYLLFDGPTGQIKPPTPDNPGGEQVQVTVYGDAVNGIEISDSEIRDSLWHAGIYASTANDIEISGNYIHDNGDPNDPGQENMSHGIYFARGSGSIVNNVIEDNVARGIQLYQGPRDVTIAHNTIVGNGKSGIQFGNETAGSVAVNNIVAYNGEYGIRSSSLTGTGNVVRGNLIWKNGTADWRTLTEGLSFVGNFELDPGFGPGQSYRLPAASAAIDRGVPGFAPELDFDGEARQMGAAPDLGAFEIR